MTYRNSIHSIIGGKPVKVRPSLDRGFIAVTAFFHYQNPRIMRNNSDGLTRRPKFTITDAEVAYWRKIHDLNEQEKPAVPIEKPAPVREYIIQTVELVAVEGGRP